MSESKIVPMAVKSDNTQSLHPHQDLHQPGQGKVRHGGNRKAGRTADYQRRGPYIKPDGAIVELKKNGIFDRELAKTKNTKVRGKTFTLPNVEVGDIIEYRYKEHRDNELAQYMRLYYQRDLPIWRVTYHVKPLQIPGFPFTMRSMAFGFKMPPFEKEPGGYYASTSTDMPAFHEEPYMPPEDQVRAWELIYYEADSKVEAEAFWNGNRPAGTTTRIIRRRSHPIRL
jgi:hypothetical protein